MESPTTVVDRAESASAAAESCRNCGAPVSTPFCGCCGQSTDRGRLTVADILSDIVEDQLSVNGSAFRTFSGLLRPGFLTQEYLRGRILRYLAPFRLFLLSTTFYVLAAGFALHRMLPSIVSEARVQMARHQARAARQARPGQAVEPVRILKVWLDSARVPPPLSGALRPVLRKQARINALPIERSVPLVINASLKASTYIVPLLVPVAAGLVWLIYWRRRHLFAEHVVFILHMHAFGFLVMGLGALAQMLWRPSYMVSDALFLVYLYVALVRVYGDGWLWTVPRLILLLGLYLGLVGLASPFLQLALIALA